MDEILNINRKTRQNQALVFREPALGIAPHWDHVFSLATTPKKHL